MRIYLKRIAVFFLAAFCTTLVLLSIPKNARRTEWARGGKFGRLPRPNVHINRGEHFEPQPAPPSAHIFGYQQPVIEYAGFSDREIDYSLAQRLEGYMGELDIDSMIASECSNNETLRAYWLRTRGADVPQRDSWERFYADIGSCDLYRKEELLNDLLHDLNTLPVKNVAIMEGGTQVKLIITFANEEQAVFKPMRFGRDYESDPNHFYFSDFERHHAEIATFHLDKILNFRRAVPTVGRIFNMTAELRDKAEKRLKKTFFISPGNQDRHHYESFSVFGDAPSYAIHLDNGRAFGRTDIDDDDIILPLRQCCVLRPSTLRTLLNFYKGPISLTEALHRFYKKVRSPSSKEWYMWHTEQMQGHRKGGALMIEHSFGEDMVNRRTFERSMSNDPVAPILATKHYPAMERRLHKIMSFVDRCISEHPDGVKGVVMAKYHNSMVSDDTALADEATEEDEEDEKNGQANKEKHA
ncbi:Extracellular serine/threonine protein kinase FAM20C [Toxocara canis]|uniref:Extracellular serine/threonine protein kinase FAM20C n=1 Tax=Toxocara canis TaxID=6265 RepID=A0A0B2VSM1_TOXCA|nr:Extracellular serine/threonine protein kinase FAM20C [Toxocara canis]